MMSYLSVSDWISIVSSIASLILAIIITVVQYKQSERMYAFERRLDERDERRHVEEIRAQVASFIIKYGDQIDLIPLCVIAAMHDDTFGYSREMYREFNCLTCEVQGALLKRCDIDMKVSDLPNFDTDCVKAVEKTICRWFPRDTSQFYDGGKYLIYSLTRYKSLPVEEIRYKKEYDSSVFRPKSAITSYSEYMTDVLSEVFRSGIAADEPLLNALATDYGFGEDEEIVACRFVTELAFWLATYGGQADPEKNYGHPEDYFACGGETMEDLFLLAMSKIYIHLIIGKATPCNHQN